MDNTMNPALLERVPTPTTNRARWIGRGLSGLPILFLTFDAAIKLLNRPEVAEASARLGLPSEGSFSVGLGVTSLGCLIPYLLPRTAALGAVLLTGYLGGAVLAHLRIADPLFSHTLFPIYVGALLWAGLYLRDPRVRELLQARH